MCDRRAGEQGQAGEHGNLLPKVRSLCATPHTWIVDNGECSVTGNVFSFMCKDNEYGCHATATSGAVWTGVITDIGLDTPTEAPVTRTPYLNEGLEAWGIKLISVSRIGTHERRDDSDVT